MSHVMQRPRPRFRCGVFAHVLGRVLMMQAATALKDQDEVLHE